MKTLDEVIKAYEICLNINETSCRGCPYTEFNAEGKWACSLCGNCTEDTLSYLKEYRTLQYGYIKAMADLEDNPPLSWDELKQMEGKPVWIVPEEEKGYWFVIEFFNNNSYYGGDRVIFTNDVILNRCDLGKTWQAYRKERHEDAR